MFLVKEIKEICQICWFHKVGRFPLRKMGLDSADVFFGGIDSTRFSQPSPPFTAETSQASKHVPRRSKGSPFTSTNWCSCWMPNTSWAGDDPNVLCENGLAEFWIPSCDRKWYTKEIFTSFRISKLFPIVSNMYIYIYIILYHIILYYIIYTAIFNHLTIFYHFGASAWKHPPNSASNNLDSPIFRHLGRAGEVVSTWLPSPIIHKNGGFLKLEVPKMDGL